LGLRLSRFRPASFKILGLLVILTMGFSPALVQAATSPSASSQGAGSACAAGYGFTPDGCALLSCIHQVGDGASVRTQPDGSSVVTYADGSEQTFAPCAVGFSPQFQTNGWVEDAESVQSTHKMTGNWTVPAAPSSNDRQLVYMFIGTQHCVCSSADIVQPVIQWGYGSANGGGPFWGFASWYVTSSGSFFVSRLKDINAGDELAGLIKQTGSSCGNSCSWIIKGTDATLGTSTTLKVAGLDKQADDFVTLEVYNLARCSDYPASGSTAFTRLLVNSHTVSGWSLNVLQNDGCHEQVTSSNPSTVSLFY